MSDSESVPTSNVRPASRIGLVSFVPLVVALVCAWLLWTSYKERGKLLHLRALDGHGLAVGDGVVYRGVRVGEVEEIRLTEDLDELVIATRLSQPANGLAREGSRFWIERPRVSLDGIQGLDTLLGGRRIGVLPGPADGSPRSDFTLLPEPPLAEPDQPGGLEFWLEASDRHGLVAGAPVMYRGVEIGYVLKVGLSPDATSVEARAWVRPRYVALIRERTHFYEVGGLEVDAGLFEGVELNLTSLRTLLVGGVAIALDAEPGPAAVEGARFRLHDEPKKKWLEEGPALAIGEFDSLVTPDLVPVELTYKKGLFRRRKTHVGWGLPTSNGIVTPSNLVTPPEDSREVVFTVDGVEKKLLEPLWQADGLTHQPLVVLQGSPWPIPEKPNPGVPDEALLINGTERAPVAISKADLHATGTAWRLDAPVIWDDEWHGALLVRPSDSRVLGMCVVTDEGGRVVPVYERRK